jgi:peptidoglycan/LPS O-acetylase OafA/YrhL
MDLHGSGASPASRLDTKPHYEVLDGLRGVAAVMVVLFHLFEGLAEGDHHKQIINHGYLAVDFFFVLSGFVVGFAYDDRWGRMSLRHFFLRRLIRLHPMIVMGMLVGAITFYLQACNVFPLVAGTPVWKLLLFTLIGCALIPVLPSMDIRGWQEMHPLNGPAWTLFFEYIANVLYGLFLRRASKKMLALLTFAAAFVTLQYAITCEIGDMTGGWSFDAEQLRIGFTRVAYPFLAGLLLSRMGRPVKLRHAFLLCSLLLAVSFSVPRLGGYDHLWVNGLYEACCIIFLFPLIVFLGAGRGAQSRVAAKASRFLGDISYPLYMTHYPLVYVYFALMVGKKIPESAAIPGALLVFIGAILLSWASSRFYDAPVRDWLKKRFLRDQKKDFSQT